MTEHLVNRLRFWAGFGYGTEASKDLKEAADLIESRVLAEREQEPVEQRLIDDSNGAWAAFERSEYADMSNRADLWPVWQDAWNAHPMPDDPQSQGERAASEDVRTARYEWMLKMLMADGWTERGIDKEIAAIAGEKK